MVETTTFTIEAPDGATTDLDLPTPLVDLLSEEGDTPADVVGDMAVLSFAQQAHALVHHGQGEANADLEAAEEAVVDEFEERFGVSFAEATGHSH